MTRRTRAPIVSRSGRTLPRLLWRLLNHRRPIAGHAVTVYRGSPLKRSGASCRAEERGA